MDFNNFIRGFFGLRRPKHHSCDDCTESFGYQCPEESSDEINSSIDSTFFNDGRFFGILQPMDPISTFQQIEDLFRNFSFFDSGRMLDFPSMEEPFNDHKNYNDFLLKPPEGKFNDFFGREWEHEEHPEFSNIEPFHQPKNPRDFVLKPSYRDTPNNSVKSAYHKDSDIDGAPPGDIFSVFPQQPKLNWSFRKSVFTRIVRGSDGTVEEHRTVKDGSGTEVTTVRKSIGDQSYTVTLRKDSEGLNEKKEDFVNLDEKDVPEFEERWHKMKDNTFHAPKDLLQEPECLLRGSSGDPYYQSIFQKLFRF